MSDDIFDPDYFNKINKHACDKLVETYDCNVFDNMGPMLRNSFYRKIEDENNCIKVEYNPDKPIRNVLVKLIKNHFNKENIPTPRFIGGPKSLTVHYSKEYDKTVYIFGEFHNTEINCTDVGASTLDDDQMSIEDFLSDLLKKTNVFLNIFLEFKRFESTSYPDETLKNYRLHAIFEKLKICIQTSTRHDENCVLGRVNWIDTRKGIDNSFGMFTQFYFLIENNNKNEDEYSRKLNLLTIINNYKTIFEILNSFVNETAYNYLADIFKTNKYIIKEYKTSDIKTRDKIYNFFLSKLKQTVNESFTVIKNNINFLLYKLSSETYLSNIMYSEIYESAVNIGNFFLYYESLSMDCYTILRCFKDYDITNSEKPAFFQAIIGDQPKKANNIIIYSGEYHSIAYRKILKFLKFKMIEKAGVPGDIKETCINTDSITMPFFQKNKLLAKFNKQQEPIVIDSDDPDEKKQFSYNFGDEDERDDMDEYDDFGNEFEFNKFVTLQTF